MKKLKVFKEALNKLFGGKSAKGKEAKVKLLSTIGTVAVLGSAIIGGSASCGKKADKAEVELPENSISDTTEPTIEDTTSKPQDDTQQQASSKSEDDANKDSDKNTSNKKTGLQKYNIQFNDDFLNMKKSDDSKSNEVNGDKKEEQSSDSQVQSDVTNVDNGKASDNTVQNINGATETPIYEDNSLQGTVTENGVIYASEQDKNLIGQEVITQILPDEEAVDIDWGGLYYDEKEDVAYKDEQSYIDYENSKNDEYFWVDGVPYLTQEDADIAAKESQSIDPTVSSTDNNSDFEDYMSSQYGNRYVADDGTVYYFTDEAMKYLNIDVNFKSAAINENEIFISSNEEVKEETKVEEVKEETKVEEPKEETKVEEPKEETKVEEPKEETKVEEPKEETKVEEQKEEIKDDEDSKTSEQIIDVQEEKKNTSTETYYVPNDVEVYGAFAGTEWVSQEDFELVWQCLQEEAAALAETAEGVKTR